MGEGKLDERLRLHVLASGSKGNCAVVEDTATGRAIMVDCGICRRDALGRLDALGVDPARVEAVAAGLADAGCGARACVAKQPSAASVF